MNAVPILTDLIVGFNYFVLFYFVAIRPASAVSWPTSGSVAPGHGGPPGRAVSSSMALTFGSFCGWSRLAIVAVHSPKRLCDAPC